MENELIPQEEKYGIEISKGNEAAALLKASMNRKLKKIFFNGKEYAEFHDLQVVANYYGHSIRTHDALPVNIDGVNGFKAHADLINKDGIQIGGSEAYCMRDEPMWNVRNKYEWKDGKKIKVGEEPVPLFQLASMAQTRAASKCVTNVYRWVLDLAGYGTTPAEEMTDLASPAPSWAHPGDTPPVPHGKKPGKEYTNATITLFEIKDFTSKKGTNFCRIYDKGGAPYMIFDAPVIEYARTLVGSEVSISYEVSKYGNTIKDLVAL